MQQCLMVLIATPKIEAVLLEWLLAKEDVPTFASLPVDGHGIEHHHLSMAEQVAGRQRQIMFQIPLELEAARRLAAALKEDFGQAELSYWLIPILEGGPIE